MREEVRPTLFLVTPRFGGAPGGLGVSAVRIARHLSTAARLVVFETTPDLPPFVCEEVEEDAPWTRLRVSLVGERRQARQFLSDVLLARARQSPPELLATFFTGELSLPVLLTARLLDRRTVLFTRGNDIDLELFGESALEILHALGAAARVYCVTRELEQKIARWVPGAQARYVPNGVDPGLFTFVEPPPPSERPWVGLFGDLKAKKGLELLLAHFDFERFRLRIVGDLRPDMEKLLHGFLCLHPERARDLHHTPYTSDRKALLRHYGEVDLVCVPSVHEGMSNVMLEAMSTGRACVCSRVGGALDVISDGVDGFLFDALSPEGFGDAMQRAAAALRADARGLGLRARRKVEEQFSAEQERAAYLHDLQTLLRR